MLKKKELVIFDLDNVIINGQSQKVFLDYLFENRIVNLLFYFKISLWFLFFKLGIVNNPRNIMEYAFKALNDMSVEEVEKIIDDFFNKKLKKCIFKQMIDIINKHKTENREIIIVSNAIDVIVKKVAGYLGIKNYISTKLEIKNDKFTGRILGELVYGGKKLEVIKKFLSTNNYNISKKWGYGDHFTDLSILLFVDIPIATNPDKILLKEAKKRDWQVLFLK